MHIPTEYNEQLSLREQVAYVISLLQKASADTIAMELMELRGLAAEEEVANTVVEVKNELENMRQEQLVTHQKLNDKNVWSFTEQAKA